MQRCIHLRTVSCSPKELLEIKKRRYYLFFRRWGRFARNVPSGEERGETDVFAGHVIGYSSSILPLYRYLSGICYTFETKAYFLVVSFSNKKFARHDVLLWGRSKYQETVRKVFFARSDWLLKLGISSAFGQSERPQTRDGQMASRLATVYKINCE